MDARWGQPMCGGLVINLWWVVDNAFFEDHLMDNAHFNVPGNGQWFCLLLIDG